MSDDATLLRRYAETRAEDAFGEIVRRHLDGVYSVALRRVGGDVHLAEDVTQQVFVALARKAGTLARHPALTSWLHTATRHEAANAVRSERRRKAREHEALIMHEISSDQESARDWSRVAPVLDAAIDELNEADRTAVLLRFTEHRGFAEIGRALRVTEDAARMRVERALDKLRTLLARRGVTSTAAGLGVALANHAAVAAPAGLAATVTGAAVSGTAVAAGAGALLATAGIFMNKTVIIPTAVAILAFGFGMYEHRRAEHIEAVAAMAARERDSSNTQLRAAREAAAVAARPGGTTSKASGSLADSRSVVAQDPALAALTARELDLKAKDAAVQHAVYNQEVRRRLQAVDASYRAFYRLASFTSEQVEQFRNLVEKNNRRRTELRATVRDQNSPGSAATLQAALDQGAAEFTVDMRALFGEENARKLERYNETMPLRAITERLAINLFYTEVPLAAGQAEQLIEIMGKHYRGSGESIDLTKLDLEGMLIQSQAILSPSQVAELRDIVGWYVARKPYPQGVRVGG